MGKRLFSNPKHPDRLWGLPILFFHTFVLLSPAVKWLEHEVQHLLPPSAKDENKWCYNITSPVCLNGVHRDESAFTYHIHCPHFSTSIYSNYLLKTWLHSDGLYEENCLFWAVSVIMQYFLSTDLIFEYSHFAIVSSSQHFRLHQPLLQFFHFASTLQCRYLQHALCKNLG